MNKLCRRICLALILMCVCFSAGAQAKIYTKKARLADFPTKVIKVVLTGNSILDEILRREVSARWYLSPYEFCTVEDFNALQNDPSYYFLRFSMKDGSEDVLFLSVMKGGKTGNDMAFDAQYEVFALPCAPRSMSSGRETIFFPAMIDIVQQHVEAAGLRNISGYLSLQTSFRNIFKMRGKKVLVAQEDLSFKAAQADSLYKGGITVVETDDADASMLDEDEDVVVSYSITPDEESWKSFTYVMLIDAHTHDLYYYARHRYTSEEKRGFTRGELRFIDAMLKRRHADGEDD